MSVIWLKLKNTIPRMKNKIKSKTSSLRARWMRKLKQSFILWTNANVYAKGIKQMFATAKMIIKMQAIGM